MKMRYTPFLLVIALCLFIPVYSGAVTLGTNTFQTAGGFGPAYPPESNYYTAQVALGFYDDVGLLPIEIPLGAFSISAGSVTTKIYTGSSPGFVNAVNWFTNNDSNIYGFSLEIPDAGAFAGALESYPDGLQGYIGFNGTDLAGLSLLSKTIDQIRVTAYNFNVELKEEPKPGFPDFQMLYYNANLFLELADAGGFTTTPSTGVPEPATLLLLGSGLLGLIGFRKKFKK